MKTDNLDWVKLLRPAMAINIVKLYFINTYFHPQNQIIDWPVSTLSFASARPSPCFDHFPAPNTQITFFYSFSPAILIKIIYTTVYHVGPQSQKEI